MELSNLQIKQLSEQIVGHLSSVQFENKMGVWTYIFVLISAAIGSWASSYIKERAKNTALNRNFDEIYKQLERNTVLVEDIKKNFSEKNWISQQLWLKKQEAYNEIFIKLLDVRKHVAYQCQEYSEYEDEIEHHPYNQSQEAENDPILRKSFEVKQEDLKKKWSSEEYKKVTDKLKSRFDIAIEDIPDTLHIHAIYLDKKVEKEIEKLKTELSQITEHEDWSEYLLRMKHATNNCINNIREISVKELKLHEL